MARRRGLACLRTDVTEKWESFQKWPKKLSHALQLNPQRLTSLKQFYRVGYSPLCAGARCVVPKVRNLPITESPPQAEGPEMQKDPPRDIAFTPYAKVMLLVGPSPHPGLEAGYGGARRP